MLQLDRRAEIAGSNGSRRLSDEAAIRMTTKAKLEKLMLAVESPDWRFAATVISSRADEALAIIGKDRGSSTEKPQGASAPWEETLIESERDHLGRLR